MAHARLAPSSSHRWLTCPGSIEQSAGFPNRTTDASEMGTALHWLAQFRLEGGPWEEINTVEIDDQSSTEPGAKKLITITDQEREWVRTATDYAYQQLALYREAGATLRCETRVVPGTFYGVPDELFGTADVQIDIPGRELIIADFKFGQGHVEHRENPQLTLYAIGAAERTGWSHPAYRLVILQPRTGTGEAREELLTRRELLQRAESYRAGVIAATRANAALVPSDEGCRWCPAAGRCAALQQRGLELAMRQFADPRFITESETLLLLSEAKRIRVGLDAVEEYAEQCLAGGIAVPGWKRVRANTNRKWVDEADAELTLAQYLEPSEYRDMKLISPSQAEKRMGKMAGMIQHLITKPEGAPTLAPESDRRPALPADV